MNDRRRARLFFITAIVPLAVLWLVLRFVLDVPVAIVTLVVTVLAVASVVLWGPLSRRRRSEPLDPGP